MPSYTYQCKKRHTVQIERKAKDRDIEVKCQVCGALMKRGLSKTQPPTEMERVDEHRNVKQRKNNQQRIKDRAKKFFIENELPELVGKHGEAEAKRFGWIKNGKLIKKSDAT